MRIENCVGENARGPFITIIKWLQIANIHEGQQRFFVDALFRVYDIAETLQLIFDLELIVERLVYCTGNTNKPFTQAVADKPFGTSFMKFNDGLDMQVFSE